MIKNIVEIGFETRAIKMEPYWLVAFQAPEEDVNRIFEEITKYAPLVQGKTDSNAYRVTGGMEHYRPREGSPTGSEDSVRHRPNIDEVRFFLPKNTALLEQVIGAIYEVHSYFEPVISVQETLRSTCKGLDDKDNPHRWWNKGGDWKNKDADG